MFGRHPVEQDQKVASEVIASPCRRFLAAVLDSAVVAYMSFFVHMALGTVMVFFRYDRFEIPPSPLLYDIYWALAMSGIVANLIYQVLMLPLLKIRGQTLGKMIVRIRS